jgi:hypothetical protein
MTEQTETATWVHEAIEEIYKQIAALQAENVRLAVQIDTINQRIAPIAPQLQPDLVVADEVTDVDGDAQ